MERKWYSVKEIQKIVQLSPGVLRELLKTNRDQLTLEVKIDKRGKKEIFLDHGSLERIIFFKQLLLGEDIGQEEACLQLKEYGERPAHASVIEETLQMIETEVKALNGKFHHLLVKYNQVLRDLSHCRADNSLLRKELFSVRKKQNSLLEQIQKNTDLPFEISKETIN